ncbi:hypothetical protein HPB47_009140 [Ixodes persulcatus]|uniref:Uncharacterized protein n=1 Tax=Ixodes persulcatus TaxID=34615 RepID=A0AC60P2V7_IXOPE|nr:hypothetical protein HPB47_009140 [Ixodes persulcatus]
MNINFNQQCGHGYVVIDEYPCPGRQHGFHESMNDCSNHGFGNTYVVIDEYHDSNHAGFYNRRYNNRQWHPQFNAQNVLFELNTYTACCVLDICENSEAKQKVLQLYTEGKQAIGKTAYDIEIQRTVAEAVENKRISWKGASGTLRKLARIQWSVPSVQTDALPMRFYIQQMQDELVKAAKTGS